MINKKNIRYGVGAIAIVVALAGAGYTVHNHHGISLTIDNLINTQITNNYLTPGVDDDFGIGLKEEHFMTYDNDFFVTDVKGVERAKNDTIETQEVEVEKALYLMPEEYVDELGNIYLQVPDGYLLYNIAENGQQIGMHPANGGGTYYLSENDEDAEYVCILEDEFKYLMYSNKLKEKLTSKTYDGKPFIRPSKLGVALENGESYAMLQVPKGYKLYCTNYQETLETIDIKEHEKYTDYRFPIGSDLSSYVGVDEAVLPILTTADSIISGAKEMYDGYTQGTFNR